MKKCIKCNSFIDDNELNCPICGFDFSTCNKCPKCGKDYLGFSYICSYCGTPLYNNIVHQEKPALESSDESVISNNTDINTQSPQTADCPSVDNEKSTSDDHDSQLLVTAQESTEIPSVLIVLNDNQNSLSSDESDTDNDIIILKDDEVKEQDNTVPVKNEIDKKQYNRRHVSYPTGRHDKKDNTKKMNLVNEPEDVENEEEEKINNRRSRWRHCLLLIFFFLIIIAGIIGFLYYDNIFNKKTEAHNQAKTDSLYNIEKEKQKAIKRNKEKEDSILKSQISAIHESDSLEELRKREYRRQDSLRVDTFMTRVINNVCPNNQILARLLDGENYIYFYTDISNPIFVLYGFDGVKKETFTIIDNIQAKLVASYVTPDRRNLIILCKDDKHEYGLAYKYNMYDSTVADYESMDKEGNKCFDIGKTDDGFCMKFGKGDNNSFTVKYTAYFDKYGNFITQE